MGSPVWGDSGTANVVEPPDQLKQEGWQDFDNPTAKHMNWVLQNLGIARRFTAQEVAAAQLSAGQLAMLDEEDSTQKWGSPQTDILLPSPVKAVDVDSLGVLIVDNSDNIRAYSRDLATLVQTYIATLAGTVLQVISNGQWVAAAYGNIVELWDRSTGVSQWTFDHGATVQDIAMDATNIYLVGGTGTGTHHARAIDIGAGTATWSYDHGGVLSAITATGRNVIIAGAVSSFGSGANFRSLQALNGFDLANEGGTGTSVDGMVWDIVLTTVIQARCLATDGEILVLGFPVAAANELELRSLGEGTVVATRTLPATCQSVAIDQDYVYAGLDNAEGVRAYSKRQLANTRWTYSQGGVVMTGPIVASDGTAVFVGKLDDSGGGGDKSLVRLFRGNRAGLWKRVDPTDLFLPGRQLLQPLGTR